MTGSKQYDYDLFVIGGGSGGVRASRIAAGFGAKVAVAEDYRVGGTCVIRGCVPKKLLVYASRFAHEFEDAAGFGWKIADGGFDWPTLVANKDKEIARLNGIYERMEAIKTRIDGVLPRVEAVSKAQSALIDKLALELLAEQRRTNRLLQALLYGAVGFVLGVLAVQLSTHWGS